MTDLERLVFSEVYCAELRENGGAPDPMHDARNAVATALRAVRLLRAAVEYPTAEMTHAREVVADLDELAGELGLESE